jgi:flagellin
MALSINTNLWSLNAQRALSLSQTDFTRSSERLSTFLRINRASDDPLGNAVVERYTAQINGIDQARRNLSHGTVFAQHADSNLESVNDQLQTIREKVATANGTSDPLALQALQDEIQVALSEVERLVQSTEFDGRKILNGASSNTIFQVGPNAADTVGITTGNFQIGKFGLYRLKGNATGHNLNLARGGTGEVITLRGVNSRSVLIEKSGPGASAKEIAAAVNGVREATQISASARTDIEVINWTQGSYTFDITSKGDVPVQVSASVTGGAAPQGIAHFTGLIAAINNKTFQTGVEASLNGEEDGIILTNAEGDNVSLTFAANGAASNLTFKEPTLSRATTTGAYVATLGTVPLAQPVTRTFTGQVIFDSATPFSVFSDPDGTAAFPAAGMSLPFNAAKPNDKTTERSAVLVSISKIDVTGVDAVNGVIKDQAAGAGEPKSTAVPASALPIVSKNWLLLGALREALVVIDHAQAAVATQQAALGSAQNRFDAIIENLDSDFSNLSVARGYIQDADVALEKSIQSQARLQFEANIAVLGQANTLQQAVLALLR